MLFIQAKTVSLKQFFYLEGKKYSLSMNIFNLNKLDFCKIYKHAWAAYKTVTSQYG